LKKELSVLFFLRNLQKRKMNRLSLVCVDAQGDRAGILTCLWANFLRLLGAGEDFYVTEMLRNTPLTLILQSTTVRAFDFRTMMICPNSQGGVLAHDHFLSPCTLRAGDYHEGKSLLCWRQMPFSW
jgi:hypothetical protein